MRTFLILILLVAAIGGYLVYTGKVNLQDLRSGPSPAASNGSVPLPTTDGAPAVTATPVVVDISRTQARAPANGGSAVVLFSDEPDLADRNMVTCLNVWDVMDPATTGEIQVGLRKGADGAVEALRPLYWMGVAAMAPGEHTCAERMANYDYSRARTIRAKYGLDRPGPYYLVARADEQAAALIDLTGMDDRQIADMTRYFRDGFAYGGDIWDPARAAGRGGEMAAVLGPRFADSLVAALGFIAAPAVRAGCQLGDLRDAGCT